MTKKLILLLVFILSFNTVVSATELATEEAVVVSTYTDEEIAELYGADYTYEDGVYYYDDFYVYEGEAYGYVTEDEYVAEMYGEDYTYEDGYYYFDDYYVYGGEMYYYEEEEDPAIAEEYGEDYTYEDGYYYYDDFYVYENEVYYYEDEDEEYVVENTAEQLEITEDTDLNTALLQEAYNPDDITSTFDGLTDEELEALYTEEGGLNCWSPETSEDTITLDYSDLDLFKQSNFKVCGEEVGMVFKDGVATLTLDAETAYALQCYLYQFGDWQKMLYRVSEDITVTIILEPYSGLKLGGLFCIPFVVLFSIIAGTIWYVTKRNEKTKKKKIKTGKLKVKVNPSNSKKKKKKR